MEPGKKENSMLEVMRKGIKNWTTNIILPVYKSVVQPHLEYIICPALVAKPQEGYCRDGKSAKGGHPKC